MACGSSARLDVATWLRLQCCAALMAAIAITAAAVVTDVASAKAVSAGPSTKPTPLKKSQPPAKPPPMAKTPPPILPFPTPSTPASTHAPPPVVLLPPAAKSPPRPKDPPPLKYPPPLTYPPPAKFPPSLTYPSPLKSLPPHTHPPPMYPGPFKFIPPLKSPSPLKDPPAPTHLHPLTYPPPLTHPPPFKSPFPLESSPPYRFPPLPNHPPTLTSPSPLRYSPPLKSPSPKKSQPTNPRPPPPLRPRPPVPKDLLPPGPIPATAVHVCEWSATKPCRTGQCVNTGNSSYTCDCPDNFRLGKSAHGNATCLPDFIFPSQRNYTVQPTDTCNSIALRMGVDNETLEGLNQDFLNCSQALPVGETIVVLFLPCTTFYTLAQSDTCNGIAQRFGLRIDLLEGMNPGLNCSASDPFGLSTPSGGGGNALSASELCLARLDNRLPNIGVSRSPNSCFTVAFLGNGETCDSLVERYGITLLKLYELNHGLDCRDDLMWRPVCLYSDDKTTIRCENYHYVQAGETCSTLTSTYFKPKKTLILIVNNGWVCTPAKLFVGLPLCIPP